MNAFKLYIFLFICVLFSSCYEDKGDYDYHSINEVTLFDINEKYEIERWDTLIISAKLESSLSKSNNYLYSWYLNNKKIGDSPDLEYVISDKVGVYQARFEVTDPVQDSVRFFYDFVVDVHSQYDKGLLLLSEVDGQPELSFMSTINDVDGEIMYDIFELENGKSLTGNALAVEQTDLWTYGGTVWIHTSTCSHELDPVLFKEIEYLDKNSFTEPVEECNMQYCRYEAYAPDYGVGLGHDGKLYPKRERQNRYMSVSLKPIYTSEEDLSTTVDYDLEPVLLASDVGTLAYDRLSGKFMCFTNSYMVPSYDENQYDVAMVSETYVGLPWLGWGKNKDGGYLGVTSLFFDDVTGKAALARAHAADGVFKGQDSLVMLTDHHLAKGAKMVINSANNRLYYTDGGTHIYMINISDPDFKFNSFSFDCQLPANGKITMLKVSNDYLSLYVGMEIERSDKYTGDIFKVDISTGKIQKHYEGFGGTPIDLIEKEPVKDDTGE